MDEGNLPATLQAFRDAVYQLAEPTTGIIDGTIYHGDSLYQQLDQAVSYESMNSGGGGGSESKMPIWVDSFDLVNEIDIAVSIWQTDPNPPAGVPETVWRLQVLSARSWRPQDVKQLEQMTEAVTDWVERANNLLYPKPVVPLRGHKCPRCQQDTIYRQDSGGTWVRQAALHCEYGIGITCLNRRCRDERGNPTRWTWEQRWFLGEILTQAKTEELTA